MNAYIYQADIYCAECAQEIIADLKRPLAEQAEADVDIAIEKLEAELGIDLSDSPKTYRRILAKRLDVLVPDISDESSYDSDEWPKGPYGDGGGEADVPQHCGHCKEFLENPLTPEGMAYVRESQVDEWDSFYEIDRAEGGNGQCGRLTITK